MPVPLDDLLDSFAAERRHALESALTSPTFAGVLAAELVTSVALSSRELLRIAKHFAIAPTSGFAVGAVAVGASGAHYVGANAEFDGLPLGNSVHAEQSAVVGAVLGGETAIERLLVSAPPCGHCRQFLFELASAATLDVVIADQATAHRLDELLPAAFGPAHLGVHAALLAHAAPRVAIEDASASAESVVAAALAAVAKSYAPYTASPSAVALESRDGRVVAAPYVENAAYNPSLAPLLAAIDRARFAGMPLDEVVRICLVELGAARVSQRESTAVVSDRVLPAAELRVEPLVQTR